MDINYQKLEFLAEIGAEQTLKSQLPKGEQAQKPLFELKNAAKFLNILIEEGIFTPTEESIQRIIDFGDQALLDKFLSKCRVKSTQHQLFFLKSSKPEFAEKLLQRNKLTKEAQAELIALNNRDLLKLYISNRNEFDKPLAEKFIKQADDELLALYITQHHCSLSPNKVGLWGVPFFSFEAAGFLETIEKFVFAKVNPLATKAYCKYFIILDEKRLRMLLSPENEETLFSYLETCVKKSPHSVEWLAKTEDRRVLEYLVFQNPVKLPSKIESKLFEFDDAPRWLRQYFKRCLLHLSEANELRLFEPQYADLLSDYVQNGKMWSTAAHLKLLEDKYRPLLYQHLQKGQLCSLAQLKLFELNDNNELLKYYIAEKKELLNAAEQRLFEGSDRELKLYYLAQTGQDK